MFPRIFLLLPLCALAGCASAERSVAERQRDSRLAILNPDRIAAAPPRPTASPADDAFSTEISTENEKCRRPNHDHREKDCPRDRGGRGKKDDDDKDRH